MAKIDKFILRAALVFTLGLAIAGAGKDKPVLDWSELQAPAPQYRPLVRWWWPGNDVDEKELKREVDALADNWFGGAEIQPFAGGLDPKAGKDEMARRDSFDTDNYYEHLRAMLDEAQKRGMTIDLTLGSGWPSGGGHISAQQSMKTLLWGEKFVDGPTGEISIPVPKPEKPVLYKLSPVMKLVAEEANIRWMPEQAQLVTVLAAKVTVGKRSKNPLNLTTSVKLDEKSVQVLGNKLEAGGKISWQVPPGKWVIIAIYICPDGQYLSLAAESKPGFVADHFDAEVFRSHLDHLLGARTGLQKYFGAPLRAFFNDSFELKTERFFTRDFFSEFAQRRGYDLAPFLPATLVPGADNYLFIDGGLQAKPSFTFSGQDSRVRYDYQLTVSDLFIERFVDNSAKWAKERGLQSRIQPYGLNIDVLKALGHADIPEVEQLYAGGYEAFLKMAGSAAHLYNRPVVSVEADSWSGKDYMTTPLKMKVSADKCFTSGINQLIFHGFPYRKDAKYGEGGWAPFSSPFAGGYADNFGEGNSFWKYFAALNRYVSRVQYVLRSGRPEADVLIYYPWFGFPTSFDQQGKNDELLFNGEFDGEPQGPGNALIAIGSKIFPMGPDDRARWRAQVRPLIKELEDAGYTWEWVNDDSLQQAKVEGGMIAVRGNQWKALVIANCTSMPRESAERVRDLAEKGAALLVVGTAPNRQPGYKDFENGDRAVSEAFQTALNAGRAKNVEQAQLASTLVGLKVDPGLKFAQSQSPVRYIRRSAGTNGKIFFLRNPEKTAQAFSFKVESGCENAQWLDAWAAGRFRTLSDRDGKLIAELPPYGSMLLVCGEAMADIDSQELAVWPDQTQAQSQIEIKEWSLSVIGSDVPGGSVKLPLNQLKDWREIKELQYCSSPGTYKSEFELANLKPGQKVALDIGWIYGAAEIEVNGKPAGTLLVTPFQLNITSLVKPGKNQVIIVVTPSLRNGMAGKSRAGDKAYAQFKGREKDLVPQGIIGPVKVLLF